MGIRISQITATRLRWSWVMVSGQGDSGGAMRSMGYVTRGCKWYLPANSPILGSYWCARRVSDARMRGFQPLEFSSGPDG